MNTGDAVQYIAGDGQPRKAKVLAAGEGDILDLEVLENGKDDVAFDALAGVRSSRIIPAVQRAKDREPGCWLPIDS
jgi:hypothetical protein